MRNQFKISYLIVLVLLMAGAGALEAQDWRKFSPEGAGFKVKLPGKPEIDKQEKENRTTYKASVNMPDDDLYFVSWTKHSVRMEPEGEIAESSLDGFVKTTGGALSKRGVWMVRKTEGRKVRIYVEEQDFILYYYVVCKGYYQYQLVIGSKGQEPDAKVMKKFLKSFKLT